MQTGGIWPEAQAAATCKCNAVSFQVFSPAVELPLQLIALWGRLKSTIET